MTSDGVDEGSGKMMTAKEASILAWSFGALGLRPAGLYRVLAREGLATVHEAKVQDLSNLAWGLARVGVLAAEEEIEDRHEGEGIEVLTYCLRRGGMCFYVSASVFFFLNFVPSGIFFQANTKIRIITDFLFWCVFF